MPTEMNPRANVLLHREETGAQVSLAPRNVAHTLANQIGDEPARYVLVCTPAGFELAAEKG